MRTHHRIVFYLWKNTMWRLIHLTIYKDLPSQIRLTLYQSQTIHTHNLKTQMRRRQSPTSQSIQGLTKKIIFTIIRKIDWRVVHTTSLKQCLISKENRLSSSMICLIRWTVKSNHNSMRIHWDTEMEIIKIWFLNTLYNLKNV
jgi:hypothetical protein